MPDPLLPIAGRLPDGPGRFDRALRNAMSAARPPEGAHTAAEGTPLSTPHAPPLPPPSPPARRRSYRSRRPSREPPPRAALAPRRSPRAAHRPLVAGGAVRAGVPAVFSASAGADRDGQFLGLQ